MQTKLKLKKDDLVKVIAGDHKGEQGKVLSINRETLRVTVEGINMITKHQKPNAANPQGGIDKKEGSIHISNLVLLHKGTPTRIGRKVENAKSERFAKKSKNKEVIK